MQVAKIFAIEKRPLSECERVGHSFNARAFMARLPEIQMVYAYGVKGCQTLSLAVLMILQGLDPSLQLNPHDCLHPNQQEFRDELPEPEGKCQPIFGLNPDCINGVYEECDYLFDGDLARYESN
jgi:hypothetical protein